MRKNVFKDHFSLSAKDYAQNRPTYPSELFAYLASVTEAHDCAWDCATGNGQAAVGLASYFKRVIATDASKKQVMHAFPHPRIQYKTSDAHQAPIPDASVDLVTVAQALHWFWGDAFYNEVRRVLKPNGSLAIWTYGLFEMPERPEVMRILRRYYQEIIGPYWPAERSHVENKYRSLPFPFEEIPPPSFEMTRQWDLRRIVGYLRSWSATQAYEKNNGSNPINIIEPDLTKAWGSPDQTCTISWPLTLKVGLPSNPVIQ